MRATYNVLVIPYFKKKDSLQFCILKRSDMLIWQFVAGGGEIGESIESAALRELEEEIGIQTHIDKLIKLDSSATVRIDYFPDLLSTNKYVIPVFCYAYFIDDVKITLSSEHIDYRWVEHDEAINLLKFDLDKTALWELTKRIERNDI